MVWRPFGIGDYISPSTISWASLTTKLSNHVNGASRLYGGAVLKKIMNGESYPGFTFFSGERRKFFPLFLACCPAIACDFTGDPREAEAALEVFDRIS